MKVTLINYTQDALNLLLRTKNTRLANASDPAGWTDEQRADHLAYMRDTIRSSWEFVDYVFQIEGVTRAFTQQLERTRSGSYAEQSLRAVDVRGAEVYTPEMIRNWNPSGVIQDTWHEAVGYAKDIYQDLIDRGVPIQDARGVLPINITTSIVAKFDLRTLSSMAEVRLCTRTQGEYQDVFRAMRAAVIEVHPWAEQFIEVACVARGTCAFPRYGKESCPIYYGHVEVVQRYIEVSREQTKRKWEAIRHEADPSQKKVAP